MPKIKQLPPLVINPYCWDILEKLIKRSFIKMLYYPIYKQLGLRSGKNIKNTIEDLIDSLDKGLITYSRGAFRGRFNAKTSRELRKLGAIWDSETSSFKLGNRLIPIEIREIISVSAVRFAENLTKIDRRLSEILPEEFADKFDFGDYFDRTIWEIDKRFQKTTEGIVVAPQLDDERRKKIADEWENNIRLKIKDFSAEHIKKLRKTVQETTFAGNRYESLIRGIKRSYGVTETKARFLARQETNLLLAKFKETRYIDSGVHEYRWTCVRMPKDKSPDHHTPGNVRYAHGILDGEIHRFDDPPLTSNPGDPEKHNNPGEDYNCLPGGSLVGFHSPILKAFRRGYSGKLTKLVTDNGIVIDTTANHPILTNRGWVPANKIKFGDYILSSKIESLFTSEMKRQDVKPSCQNIFNALSFCMQVSTNPISETDFHGDIGSNKEIDIVSVNRKLIYSVISKAQKELAHFLFTSANSKTSTFRPSNTLLKNLLMSSIPSSYMSILGQLDFILKAHILHSDKISVRSIPSSDLRSGKPSFDNITGNPVFVRDSQLTHPILIILNSLLINLSPKTSSTPDNFYTPLPHISAQSIRANADDLSNLCQGKIFPEFIQRNRVIDNTVWDFSGHVYNFQTESNWFLSESIIIHNCRCTAIAIVKF